MSDIRTPVREDRAEIERLKIEIAIADLIGGWAKARPLLAKLEALLKSQGSNG